MNPSPKSIVCLAVFLELLALSSLAGGNDCRIANNGDGWPIVFEDTELSQSDRRAIGADYAALCALLAPQGSYETKTLDGKSIRWMQYGVERWHIPEAAKGHVGLLRVEKDGREAALVDRSLSDAYKKALAYREAHREAYDCLPEFVDLMNHLSAEDLPDTLEPIVFFAEGAQRYRAEVLKMTIEEFVDSFGRYHYDFASILDSLEFDGLPMAPLRMTKNDKKTFLEFCPVVFEGGRWKMLVYPGMF